MTRIPGVVIGVVKDRDDEEGEGRIQVEFPWLEEGQRSAWAPIATFMSGRERGAWFMPEIDDEVLVAFEHGDFDHPFIVGFLWNGVDRPPNADIDPDVRRLRTVSGHTLEFDDRNGRRSVLIRTAGGHEVELDDASGQISIRTSSGDQQVVLSDVPPSVTISCKQAEVSAESLLEVKAPMVVFDGVVRIPTLVAQTVAGTSYTPAPGNTYGL